MREKKKKRKEVGLTLHSRPRRQNNPWSVNRARPFGGRSPNPLTSLYFLFLFYFISIPQIFTLFFQYLPFYEHNKYIIEYLYFYLFIYFFPKAILLFSYFFQSYIIIYLLFFQSYIIIFYFFSKAILLFNIIIIPRGEMMTS